MFCVPTILIAVYPSLEESYDFLKVFIIAKMWKIGINVIIYSDLDLVHAWQRSDWVEMSHAIHVRDFDIYIHLIRYTAKTLTCAKKRSDHD